MSPGGQQDDAARADAEIAQVTQGIAAVELNAGGQAVASSCLGSDAAVVPEAHTAAAATMVESVASDNAVETNLHHYHQMVSF